MGYKKFTRSVSNRCIAGVCGGLSEYFNVDITLLRAIFVALAIFGGGGLILYLILWLLAPEC
ncbi:MAG TPA: PspC domain-containing protein [Bacteroidales bacterium]|nr:PspC domain-containing protein [Bacteroidales bacterium]HQB19003.1 PspC domain-containing protein [Bacteroidales bacterium]